MCEIYLLIKNKLEPFILVYKYVTFNRKQQFGTIRQLFVRRDVDQDQPNQ